MPVANFAETVNYKISTKPLLFLFVMHFPQISNLNSTTAFSILNLNCDVCRNGETPSLYADIDGALVPVAQSLDGSKYQVNRCTHD